MEACCKTLGNYHLSIASFNARKEANSRPAEIILSYGADLCEKPENLREKLREKFEDV